MAAEAPGPTAKVYRPGATLVPLFLWALLLGVSSGLLLNFLAHPPAGFEAKGLAVLMAALGILFGPVAFFIHLVRMCVTWVAVDPDRGLRFSSGRTLPWGEVRAVELRESAFKGFIRPSPLIVLVSIGCWAMVYFVVLPSCALFTPWHRRVILRLASGETVVLRDLAGAAAFLEEVHRGIESARPSGPSGKPSAT